MVNMATASWYSASSASGTCSSSSSSSWASTTSTWAEHAPDCFRCKGTPPRKSPARGIAVSIASLRSSYSYRLMAALTICDCFSANKLVSQEHLCLNQRIHLSSHCLEVYRQNVEFSVVIPDFLTWLALEIMDEIIHSPTLSKYFNRLKKCPWVIKLILNTIQGFQVLYHFTRIEGTSFESLQKFTSPSLQGHSGIGHKETTPAQVAGKDLFCTSLLPQQKLKGCDAATSLATKITFQFRHLTTRQPPAQS